MENQEKAVKEPIVIEISSPMLKKIEAIDEEFKKVQSNLNNQLQLMLDCYCDALIISENQYWRLSSDKKHIEIYEKSEN